jgi:hypothetical protein
MAQIPSCFQLRTLSDKAARVFQTLGHAAIIPDIIEIRDPIHERGGDTYIRVVGGGIGQSEKRLVMRCSFGKRGDEPHCLSVDRQQTIRYFIIDSYVNVDNNVKDADAFAKGDDQ